MRGVPSPGVCRSGPFLLFFYKQAVHRAGLRTLAAGNAFECLFGCGILSHHMHRADLNAGSAACAEFLVHHVNTEFVLCDSVLRAVPGTLAALNTGYRFGLEGEYFVYRLDPQSGKIQIVALEIGIRTYLNAGEAVHALGFFVNLQTFHNLTSSLSIEIVLHFPFAVNTAKKHPESSLLSLFQITERLCNI